MSVALAVSFCFAQSYRCDWSVNGIAGGSMSSTSYRTDATAGQTAIGQIAGTAYQAFIGFWQIDTSASGIKEEVVWSQVEPLMTRLDAPFPNPCARTAQVRYALATETEVQVKLFDLTGRSVAVLVDARQPPGRYTIPLVANRHRLAPGVYFLKMTAGDYLATRKVMVVE